MSDTVLGIVLKNTEVHKTQSLTSRYSRGRRLLKSHLVVMRKNLDLLHEVQDWSGQSGMTPWRR